MAELYLGIYRDKPYYAIVDEEYLDILSQYKWRVHNDKNQGKQFYAVRTATKNDTYPRRASVRMHRFIMELHGYVLPPKSVVDHRNHNGLDNRIINLRLATNQQNCWNKSPKTEYRGVYKSGELYRVVLFCNGERIAPKQRYSTPEKAALAYNYLAQQYQGRFASLNPVDPPIQLALFEYV
jgi:hypothetical protein